MAIVNYIGKKAGTAGKDDAEFALSQMLLAEAEDLYAGLQKFCATAFVPLAKKTDAATAAAWWDGSEPRGGLPNHLSKLEKLLGGKAKFTSSGTTVGEVYLYSMLHQMVLVKADVLGATPSLSKFYTDMTALPGVKKARTPHSGSTSIPAACD